MIVYSLSHSRLPGDHTHWRLVDVNHVGIISSLEDVPGTVREFHLDPGPRRCLEGFRIAEVPLDTDLRPDGLDHLTADPTSVLDN